MKNNNFYNWLIVALAAVLVGFLICFVFWPYPDADLGPNMVTAFLGVFLSGALTLVLLKGQSKSDEDKDKNIKMYENKLKAFAEFNKFLWEKDELDDERLRKSCMQNLIFYLDNDRIIELLKYAEIIKSEDNKGKREQAKADILKLLKESLNANDKIDSKTIIKLSATLTPEVGSTSENVVESSHQNTLSTENPSATNSEDVSNQDDTIPEINVDEIKQQFGISDSAEFWHFNALEPAKQAERLKQPNPILSLIEYGESWRTDRLKEVNPGDIIFLFYRGGPGYVGMYQALGTQVMANEDISDANSNVELYTHDSNGVKTESKRYDDELRKNDIYEAIDDGANYVANIIVKPLASTEEWGNPCETVIRQTIGRMNQDRTRTLLKYFNKFKI